MELEVLISALKKDPVELIKQMRIETPAVLVNQCDRTGSEVFEYAQNRIKVLSDDGRGGGRSRNLCLENADKEIVLFSDEDIVYDPGYAAKVIRAFEDMPTADVLLFNVRVNEKRRTYWNEDIHRVGKLNCGRFPAYSIAARRESLIKSQIRYSLYFGGGAKYSNGEDSLFLTDCIRKGLAIYTSTEVLGEETERASTWFFGYTGKFFFDRGVLFAFLYPHTALIWAFRFVFVKKNIDTDGIGRRKAWKRIREGIREGNKLRKCGSI